MPVKIDQNVGPDGTNNSETTPLIGKDVTETPSSKRACLKPVYLVLLCGLLTSTSFATTQVPLIYVFRLMTCEAYYETHDNPPPGAMDDRCAVPTIEAGTAKAVSLLGFSTTFFGVANLFITGWGIKRFGVKSALALQVFWPAARLAVQNVGVMFGGTKGIIIVQCSQIITIIGGPNGYLLALNTYITEVTSYKERTGALGRLQGCFMFGSAIGFLFGGVLADVFDIITPFQVTLVLFLLATSYVIICLPYIPPISKEEARKSRAKGFGRLLGPLKSIAPKRWIRQDGRIGREYGALILAVGVFLAVLATGYIPTLLQMFSTDVFGFGTRRNSYLVSSHSFLRGMFLTFVFPKIISSGRRWMERKEASKASARQISSTFTSGTATPSEQQQLARAMQDEEEQDVQPPKPSDEQETYEFDLIYTRFSLLTDGVLTLGATFVTQGWHMYLVGALWPLGAGTASAAKGTILQMCPTSEKTDALSAIAFVEMIARLSTTFVFGLVFAAFTSIGKTYLVFTVNAGVALVGFLILLFSHFPPKGSRRLESKTVTDDDDDESDGP